jgi:hypothetical protein
MIRNGSREAVVAYFNFLSLSFLDGLRKTVEHLSTVVCPAQDSDTGYKRYCVIHLFSMVRSARARFRMVLSA